MSTENEYRLPEDRHVEQPEMISKPLDVRDNGKSKYVVLPMPFVRHLELMDTLVDCSVVLKDGTIIEMRDRPISSQKFVIPYHRTVHYGIEEGDEVRVAIEGIVTRDRDD